MKKPPAKFEDAFQALETIVDKLERGDLSLEEALAAYEDGVTLVRHLGTKLTEVGKRVEVLTRDAAGLFQLEPLTEDEDKDEQ
jgi:exodeoxyribonuclease VII small subunit